MGCAPPRTLLAGLESYFAWKSDAPLLLALYQIDHQRWREEHGSPSPEIALQAAVLALQTGNPVPRFATSWLVEARDRLFAVEPKRAGSADRNRKRPLSSAERVAWAFGYVAGESVAKRENTRRDYDRYYGTVLEELAGGHPLAVAVDKAAGRHGVEPKTIRRAWTKVQQKLDADANAIIDCLNARQR